MKSEETDPGRPAPLHPVLYVLAGALTGLFLVWTGRHERDPSRASQPFRVGFQHSPPAQFVALTANVMTGDRERCLDAGMDGYVSKPINLGDLLAMISAVCGTGDTAPTRVGFPAGPPDS